MGDLIYRQAVTEDGEPVAVTETQRYYSTDDLRAESFFVTRPCSWAVILPGDTVNWDCGHGYRERWPGPFVVAEVTEHGVTLRPHDHLVPMFLTDSADLTLVCGSPSELRERNPAWRWDR